MGDAMDWVIRDAYLSKGNQGLKGAASALLKILAMEENHEEIVQMWITMQKKLLNPQHPENQNPDQFEKNRQLAYEQAFEFARYNMSDVFITDIFVSNTIINLNLALASLIPMTVFHVSRRPRGEQCELKLMERMIDWGIIGDKISDQLTTELTPTAIQERGQTSRIIYKKDIEGQKESLEATCKSKAEMKEHCKGCTDRKCQDKWEKIWNLPVEKQDRVRCNRDSPEDEPYDEITFFPLNPDTFPIKDEGFQGAKVGIYNRGFYTKNQAVKFKVTKSKLLEMKDKFRIALEKQIAGLEKKEFTYQGKKVKYQIKDKAGLTQEILGKFDQIIAEGKATDIDDVIIWEGCPMLIHVDVASMYPSIIINWNLQPYWIVDPEEDCATCPHRYDERMFHTVLCQIHRYPLRQGSVVRPQVRFHRSPCLRVPREVPEIDVVKPFEEPRLFFVFPADRMFARIQDVPALFILPEPVRHVHKTFFPVPYRIIAREHEHVAPALEIRYFHTLFFVCERKCRLDLRVDNGEGHSEPLEPPDILFA